MTPAATIAFPAETIASAAVDASFEDWPAQLGAAALSLALYGFVYVLITFWPLIAAEKVEK